VLAPGEAVTDAAAKQWPAEARRALVEEFLDSPQAAELRDPIARKVPHLLAMCCVGHLGCEPVLIGPSVLERVLLDALPRAAITPDRFGKAVPQAVRAWTGWLAERNKLTDRSRRRLGFSLRATLAQFAGAWYAAGAHPLRRNLEDLDDEDASTGDVVNAVIERRVFAVPLPAERVDGLAEESDGSRREASELDAAVSGDRTLITVMEASARGVPQQRFPSFVTVAQQLWDGDPLEGVAGSAAAARCRAVAGLGNGPAGADLGRARGRREVCRDAEATVMVHHRTLIAPRPRPAPAPTHRTPPIQPTVPAGRWLAGARVGSTHGKLGCHPG
jgi:hypothetical protein